MPGKREIVESCFESQLEVLARVPGSSLGSVYMKTAVSKKVVGKSARDNPERYCGQFVSPVLQRKLKEWHERPRTYVRECYWKATKIRSTATVVRNSVLIISHITFRDCRVHNFTDNLSRSSCMHPQKAGFSTLQIVHSITQDLLKC